MFIPFCFHVIKPSKIKYWYGHPDLGLKKLILQVTVHLIWNNHSSVKHLAFNMDSEDQFTKYHYINSTKTFFLKVYNLQNVDNLNYFQNHSEAYKIIIRF